MSYTIKENAKKRFKVWLVQNDLTLRQFATKCGVSHQYVSQVVCGKRNITPNVIETFKRGGYELI